MLFNHETVAVCEPNGGLTTWKIKVRIVAAVPESVPGINVPLTPPRLAVILVALFANMRTMIIAARLAPLPTRNAGVVIRVTSHSTPELTELSYVTLPVPVPGAATVSETGVVCVKLPFTPVIVSV